MPYLPTTAATSAPPDVVLLVDTTSTNDSWLAADALSNSDGVSVAGRRSGADTASTPRQAPRRSTAGASESLFFDPQLDAGGFVAKFGAN